MTDRSADGRRERVARSLTWLARYDALVDDAPAFRAALEERPPVDLLVLPRRLSPEALAAGLAARGLRAERLAAAPHHLRVHGAGGAGALAETLLGLAHPQGIASAIGPQALAPRPGEVLLDLCAAPGGKTILLDALADARALLVAGEPSVGRAGILVQSLARCGVASTLVVRQDGRAFPRVAVFDRILLDAPCTGEGTFRVPSPRYDLYGEEGHVRMPPLQARLLSRALDLLAPGGRLVYSTCAYAPEENEAVLDTVLARRGDAIVVPLDAGAPGLPGVTEWQGRRFRGDVAHARRILPHHLGSWGFFVALLEKDPGGARGEPPGSPEGLRDDADARATCEGYFARHFGGLSEDLAEVVVHARGRDYFVLPRAAALLDVSRLQVVAPGLRLLHRTGRSHVATNAGLRWLGPRVRSNVVDLSYSAAVELCVEGSVAVPGQRDRPVAALRVDGILAGKGAVRDGRVTLDLPAGWR